MKRRWKTLAGLGLLAGSAVLIPLVYIEGGCAPGGGTAKSSYQPLLPAAHRRPEVRTLLTYPEWHIVYSAESFGRHLAAGRRPSGYRYLNDIGGFWSSYCTLNRAAGGDAAAGEAKVMIYTIGISFTAELLVKALYENIPGRLTEALSGWTSADDRHAATVQQSYAAFMHETPWYRFPFGDALAAEWRTTEPSQHLRHWERRLALSLEYGVKAGYARLIGWASGATLGRDETRLRFVARATPAQLRAIDPRLRPVTQVGSATIVEAPRYAQFTDLLVKMAERGVALVEIAGNDAIFATLIMRDGPASLEESLFSMPLGDRPGWRRVGVKIKIADLLPLIRRIRKAGGAVEHVYDY